MTGNIAWPRAACGGAEHGVRCDRPASEPSTDPAARVAKSTPKPPPDRPIGPGSTAYSGEHGEDGGRREVGDADADGEGAQQPVAGEIADAFGDVGAEPVERRRESDGSGRRAVSTTAATRYAAALPARATGQRDAGDDPADRRADELVGRQLDGVEATVGQVKLACCRRRWAGSTGRPCRTSSRRRRARRRRRTAARAARGWRRR